MFIQARVESTICMAKPSIHASESQNWMLKRSGQQFPAGKIINSINWLASNNLVLTLNLKSIKISLKSTLSNALYCCDSNQIHVQAELGVFSPDVCFNFYVGQNSSASSFCKVYSCHFGISFPCKILVSFSNLEIFYCALSLFQNIINH